MNRNRIIFFPLVIFFFIWHANTVWELGKEINSARIRPKNQKYKLRKSFLVSCTSRRKYFILTFRTKLNWACNFICYLSFSFFSLFHLPIRVNFSIRCVFCCVKTDSITKPWYNDLKCSSDVTGEIVMWNVNYEFLWCRITREKHFFPSWTLKSSHSSFAAPKVKCHAKTARVIIINSSLVSNWKGQQKKRRFFCRLRNDKKESRMYKKENVCKCLNKLLCNTVLVLLVGRFVFIMDFWYSYYDHRALINRALWLWQPQAKSEKCPAIVRHKF